ncbi:MAG: zinc-binding dehydrogenase [Candidatus Thorarchaeota archaeon]
MKGIYYDLKIYKAALKKVGLARTYSMIKYKEDWLDPEIRYPRQVKVRSLMSGICASDLHQIEVDIPYVATILAQRENPFPMGHEVVGIVTEVGVEVEKLKVGDKVVFSPIANCKAYGFEECPSCKEGDYQSCLTLAGLGDGSELEDEYGGQMAFGGFGGGGFSEHFLAFEGQLTKVDPSVPNDIAVLAEPFSVALHAVLKRVPGDDETAIVIGAGIIGLMMIASIRALGSKCKIITMARHPAQVEAAKRLGSDIVIIDRSEEGLYDKIADLTDGALFKPAIGKRVLFGNRGPDVIFDSVGSGETIDDALHLVRTNGTIVIVGMAFGGMSKIEWALQIYKELDVLGSMMHGREVHEGREIDTFDLAIDFLKEYGDTFKGLVTHRFPISEYKNAFSVASNKGKHDAIKVVFDYT